MTDQGPFYTPSPAADAAYVIEGFFVALANASSPVVTAAVGEIRTRCAELEKKHAYRAHDEAGHANLRYACAVLAAHDVLCTQLPSNEIIATLVDAFKQSGAFVREKTRSGLDRSDDPFRELVSVSKQRETFQFGSGFELVRERDDDEAYWLHVRKCFWHDFFIAVGRAELTWVLCEFDSNWFEAIDPERHHFRFERKTTLGIGGDHCPFHFFRMR